MGRFSRLDFAEAPAANGAPLEDPWPDLDEQGCLNAAGDQFDRGLYEAALVYYSRALRFNRDLAQAWTGQVRCLICLEEYREAITWSTRGLERFKDDPDLLACRGLALVLSGTIREGMEYVDGAVESKTPSVLAWLARGEALLAAGQPPVNARRCFLKAQELAPDDWRVDLRIGMALNRAALFAEARTPLTAALRRAETNPMVLFHVGCMHEGAGEWNLAAGYFQRAALARPDFKEAQERLDRVKRGSPMRGWWKALGVGR